MYTSVYCIVCPYGSTVSNRRTIPSSNNHTTSNSYQMPDKTSKDHLETQKFKRYSSPFSWRTCSYHHFLVNKGPHGSCLPYRYMHIVGTEWQALLPVSWLLRLIDTHPGPCMCTLCFFRTYRTYMIYAYWYINRPWTLSTCTWCRVSAWQVFTQPRTCRMQALRMRNFLKPPATTTVWIFYHLYSLALLPSHLRGFPFRDGAGVVWVS